MNSNGIATDLPICLSMAKEIHMIIKLTKLIVIGLFIFGLSSVNVFAQVVRLEPQKPQEGRKLAVTYDPKAEGAKFSLNDEVYVIAQLSAQDPKRIIAKATRVGDVFKYEVAIEPGTAYVEFGFMTMSA